MLLSCDSNKLLIAFREWCNLTCRCRKMESVSKDLFELRTQVLPSGYMPRVYDVNLPCQWLENCHNGKCPAFTKINGNFYCARKNTH
jgi:hypothetical protein